MLAMPPEASKSVFRTIGEGAFWTSSSTFVVKAIGLATIFIMLRQLGVGEYGVLELVLSITTLLSIFFLPGLESIVTADMGVEKGKGDLNSARNILQAFMTLQFICATVAWVAVFFGARFFASLYNVPPHYVEVVAFLFLIGPLRSAYSILFRVNLRFFLLSLLTVIEEGCKLAVLIILFFVTELGVFKILFVILASQVFALLILAPAFVRSWRSLKGGADVPMPWWALLKGHGKWGVFSSYVGNVGKSGRLWLIQRFLGAEAVGIYSVASGLMGHTAALAPLFAVVTPMLPQFVHDRARFTRLVNKAIQYQIIAYLALGIIAFFAFPPILGRLFPAYIQAFPLFQVMLVTLIPASVIIIVNPVFAALKLQKSLFVSMATRSIMTILFTYIGIMFFGIWGIVFEALVTSVLQTVERVWTLRRKVPDLIINPLHIFRFDEDDRLIIGKARAAISRLI